MSTETETDPVIKDSETEEPMISTGATTTTTPAATNTTLSTSETEADATCGDDAYSADDFAVVSDISQLAVADSSSGLHEQDSTDVPSDDTQEQKVAKALEKRKYLCMELVETEQGYVEDLGKIVHGYMPGIGTMDVPEDFAGKDKIVFGNIVQIYDWHKETFAPELGKILEDFDRLAQAFIRYERRLTMYVRYCENKPRSEYLVAEYFEFFEEMRVKLGHRLPLPGLLIKPVQRIMKYQLLLQDIRKQTDRAGEDVTYLDRALEVMKRVPKECNDMMNVGRIQGFDGKITAQGRLLMQDSLQIAEWAAEEYGRLKSRRVFLFEQILLIAESIERKKGTITNATYIYKNSLKVNKLGMSEKSDIDGPLSFRLEDKSPGSELSLLVQCKDRPQKTQWMTQLNSLLDQQRNFLVALQSPIDFQKKIEKGAEPSESFLTQPELKPSGKPTKQKHKHAKTVPHIQCNVPSSKKDSSSPADAKQKKGIFEGLMSSLRGGVSSSSSPAQKPKHASSSSASLDSCSSSGGGGLGAASVNAGANTTTNTATTTTTGPAALGSAAVSSPTERPTVARTVSASADSNCDKLMQSPADHSDLSHPIYGQ